MWPERIDSKGKPLALHYAEFYQRQGHTGGSRLAYWPGAHLYMGMIEKGRSKAGIEKVFQDWLVKYGEPFMVDASTATSLVRHEVDPSLYVVP